MLLPWVIIAFTDFGTLILLVFITFFIDTFGYLLKKGIFYVLAGVLNLYGLGWYFNNGYLIQSTVYNVQTATFINNKVDPNIAVVILAILAIFSFLFLYFEEYNLI